MKQQQQGKTGEPAVVDMAKLKADTVSSASTNLAALQAFGTEMKSKFKTYRDMCPNVLPSSSVSRLNADKVKVATGIVSAVVAITKEGDNKEQSDSVCLSVCLCLSVSLSLCLYVGLSLCRSASVCLSVYRLF